jgi:O-succinylbenzoic acid--CoA ligase
VAVRHSLRHRDAHRIVIDFESDETHVLLNPRMPQEEKDVLERAAARTALRGHVLIASSGSTGSPRLVALSKEAILTSAGAVNRHLQARESDVWCCVLPTFHVGGLGIYARAFMTGARVVSALWDAASFIALCNAERVTLSALVPAQVVDLLRGDHAPPSSVRAIVIGGGALSAELYERATQRGWPVLPSYGLTECSSQVATAALGSSDLRVLDHVEVREEPDSRLSIKSKSLLTGYVDAAGNITDPRRDGWFVTSDLGHVQERGLVLAGRVDDVIKIGGELVNVVRLEALLEAMRGDVDATLVVVSDERLGMAIHLATTRDAGELVRAFNAQVAPYEKIRRTHQLASIPRTALGKVRRAEVRRLVGDLLKLTE